MFTDLTVVEKVVGAKQAKRALRDGKAKWVFLAKDADPRVTNPIAELCAKEGVSVARVPRMKDLGEACGISVGAAVVAILR